MTMTNISVILVEPKFTGNIGAVSRVMKNFGFNDLVLINPPQLDDEAYCRAKHSQDILESAVIHKNIRDILPRYNMLVGTTGIDTEKEKEVLRRAEDPLTFAKDISDTIGRIGIVFGREDMGLYNHELALCDRLITVPTSPEYPIMNLSHAVAVILYSLHMTGQVKDEIREIEYNDREMVIHLFESILEDINYPEHKVEKTSLMFRRIMGRANATPWDYHRIMGVLSRIHTHLNR